MLYIKNYNIKDYRKERWDGFKDYYIKMMYYGDCDPSYPALNYICDRLELNLEQRFWLAFLYGTNYCVPTTFYIYNEFPDYENVDINRLQIWWEKNKNKTYFQTDRAKVKNFNLFVECFKSYKQLIGKSQVKCFEKFKKEKNLFKRYDKIYKFTNNIYYFGRFSLFNYLETINEITPLKMKPTSLNFKTAESSRNGMCYVCEKDDFVTLHHKKPKEKINFNLLQSNLQKISTEIKKENNEIDVNFWNIETVLCAYKKLFWNTRYLGYYIDRQMIEIKKLEHNVKKGIDWRMLWEFREEFFDWFFLGEKNGWENIRKKNMYFITKYGILSLENLPKITDYKRKLFFPSIGNIYNVNDKNKHLKEFKIFQSSKYKGDLKNWIK